jgi:hypothetical protein
VGSEGISLSSTSVPPLARLFPDEWLLQFHDPVERIHAVARRYLELARTTALRPAHHIEAAMLARHFADHEGLPIAAGLPNFKVGLSPDGRQYIISMFEWLKNYSAYRLERDAADRAENLGEHFATLLDPNAGYDISDAQLEKLHGLLRELREQITLSEMISIPRRVHLLQRLDKLELPSKVASLDPLYGAVMEILVTAQNLGTAGQSMSTRASQIFDILWTAHALKDGLGQPPRALPLPLGVAGPDKKQEEEEQMEIPLPPPLPDWNAPRLTRKAV